MSTLYIQVLGKLRVWRDEKPIYGFGARKVQELLCYLLLHPDQAHSRETLAELLWANSPPAQSKRCFRQAMWQLQADLDTKASTSKDVLLVESDCVQINPEADIWCDVAIFERAFELIRKIPGQDMDGPTAQTVQSALQLYKGDLLEGWYQDWCLFERERLQNIYLNMLDRMIDCCDTRHEYETALQYGERILNLDRAHERTHMKMMRLYYLLDDRTAALRQYERCVKALDQELGVKPTSSTDALYKQICVDWLHSPAVAVSQINTARNDLSLSEILEHLQQIQSVLMDAHNQLQLHLQTVAHLLNSR